MARLDPTELEALVRDYHVAVYRAAWRVLRCEADAEDVAQEVFLRVLDGQLDLERAREPRGVLVWAAARAALSRGRSEAARHTREERHAMRHERSVEAPIQAVEDAERRALVYEAMRALPAAQQAALVLRFQEELTYSALGRALGISEPSALERVKKALAGLERQLTRAGFAGAVPLVLEREGSQLQALLAASAPAPREGLASELAGLVANPAAGGVVAAGVGAGTKTAALLWPALAILATAAVAIPLWVGAGGDEGEDRDEVVAAMPPMVPAATLDGPAAAPGRTQRDDPRVASASEAGAATLPANDAVIDDNPALIDVQVRDTDGAPVADAKLVAFVRAPGLKFPSMNLQARTDGAGFARLELPIDSLDERLRDQAWAVLVDHPAAPRASETLEGLAGGEERVLELVLQASAAEAAFEVDVLVVDADGPLAGAEVALGHVVGALAEGGEVRREADATLTGPDGRVTLRGSWLGMKLVVVDARALGRSHALAELRVSGPGVYAVRVECEPVWVVAGLVRAADGSSTAGLQLSLFQEEDDWRWPYLPQWWSTPARASIGEDGRFRLFGRPAQAGSPLWLGIARSDAAPWSPFAVRVDAPSVELDLVVKHETDPRDVGAHLAEVHGRVVGVERSDLPWWAGDWVRVVLVPDGVVADELERDFLQAALLGDDDLSPPRQRVAAQVLRPGPLPASGRSLLPGVGRPRPSQRQALPEQALQQGFAPQQAQTEEQQRDGESASTQLSFHRAGLAPGRVLLVSKVHGFAPSALGPLELGRHTVRAGLELELERGRSFSGILLGANGLPLQGALVTLAGFGARSEARLERLDTWLSEHPRAADFGTLSARTDRFGRFTLTKVPADTPFRLAVAHPTHAPAFAGLDADAERGDDGSLRIALSARR